MELRDIRYFVLVAEHKNIGRAAEALELSATALGKSLRRLEKSVGAKLVQRSQKGVALTAVGAALLARIGPLRGMLNDVRREATDLSQGRAGHINLGAASATPENFVAEACAALSRQSPGITLKVTIAPAVSLESSLLKGELDICVSGIGNFFNPTDFSHEDLYSFNEVVFASAHHRLAGRKRVSLADLAGERWATSIPTSTAPQWQMLFRAFEKNGLPVPSISLDTNSPAVRLHAIAYSGYLGINSSQFVRQEARRYPLVALPVKEMDIVRNLSIIYRKGAYLSPAAQRLIEILQNLARNGGAGDAHKERRYKLGR